MIVSRSPWWMRAVVGVGVVAVAGCSGVDAEPELAASRLEPFGSEAAFESWLNELRAAQEGANGERVSAGGATGDESAGPPTSADESITNNQVDGVDEGGIVKALGGYLVVLRRGRLFTARLEDGGSTERTPISMIDVCPPERCQGTWYDEMLVHANQIVVVGYSYRVGATELGFFEVDAAGGLSHRMTRYLRSSDYYSSRNYASRLVEGVLIFYMPLPLLRGFGEEAEVVLPALQTSELADQVPPPGSGRDDRWIPIIEKARIHRPVQTSLSPMLHTVVRCDLRAVELSCSADGVIGPFGRSFYVSRDAVYLWVNPSYTYREPERSEPSVVYRMPLDGASPQVIGAYGSPVDQFSFHEADQHLNVLVQAGGFGDAMWGPEFSDGTAALVRIPLVAFSRDPAAASTELYRALPSPGGYNLRNRFVGDYLLYGKASFYWSGDVSDEDEGIYAVRYASGGDAVWIETGHSPDRIEPMGSAAVVVGNDGEDLVFTGLSLEAEAVATDVFRRPGATQAESRSHGFFYKPVGEGMGMLGLPMRTEPTGFDRLGAAEVQFLNVSPGPRFLAAGVLEADSDRQVDDACQVSCTDWYGNARPIFYRERILALLGYELIEGIMGEDGNLREVGRSHLYADQRGH